MTMTMTTDFTEVLKKAQQRRKETSKMIDAFTLEIEGTGAVEGLVGKAIKCSSYADSWEIRDRIEAIRAGMYKQQKSYARNLAESKELYKDGMRASMASSRNAGGAAWQEREAQYETTNITSYKLLVQYERMVADIEEFNKYLNGRLNWIKDRQFWLRTLEKNSRE